MKKGIEGRNGDGTGGGERQRSDEVKRSRDGSGEERRKGECWGGNKASGKEKHSRKRRSETTGRGDGVMQRGKETGGQAECLIMRPHAMKQY